MEKEPLERLLSKERDGELTPREAEELEAAARSDPEARKLAELWRRGGEAVDALVASLGEPSATVRARALEAPRAVAPPRGSSPGAGAHGRAPVQRQVRTTRRRRIAWPPALGIAAGLLVAFAAGFAVSSGLRDPDPNGEPVAARPLVDGQDVAQVTDLRNLRHALRETLALMPERVRWTALCGGRLSLGTSPVPIERAGEFYYVTFLARRSGRPGATVCQIAVRNGEEATVGWTSGGRWSVTCRVARAGPSGAVRLPTRVSYRPAGSPDGVELAAEPTISGAGPIPLMSSRIGGVAFEISVSVVRDPGPGTEGGTTL